MSSRASSKRAVSDPSGSHTGSTRSMLPSSSERIRASRARIQFSLPRTVLISPLCATIRYGWASGHEGNVFVEKREWTMASADDSSGRRRSP